MELPPAVLPVLLDVGGGSTAERLPDPLLAGGVRVRSDLEPPALDLLECSFFKTFGEELEHDGARLLGPRVGNGDGDSLEEAHARVSGARF